MRRVRRGLLADADVVGLVQKEDGLELGQLDACRSVAYRAARCPGITSPG